LLLDLTPVFFVVWRDDFGDDTFLLVFAACRFDADLG
jgi:hypothetical protein